MQSLFCSLRLAAATLFLCVGGYTLVVWGVAQLVPALAQGSLIERADGTLAGSRLVAQKFESPGYFWPRPSAPDFNAAGAGGSNESPTSSDLSARARRVVARYGATAARPLPAQLAAASGSGLDPHLSVRAARYQAARVAEARRIPLAQVHALIDSQAFAPGGALTPERLVNVLELNLALDQLSERFQEA